MVVALVVVVMVVMVVMAVVVVVVEVEIGTPKMRTETLVGSTNQRIFDGSCMDGKRSDLKVISR